MTVNVNGNHGSNFLGGTGGNGIGQNLPVGIGWVAASGNTAGDIVVVDISSILISNLSQGIYFQSDNGATVKFSLMNPAIAKNPDPQIQAIAAPLFVNSTALTAGGPIVKAPVVFTVCQITFTTPGTVFIGAR
jgi:hypothetical protein